MIMPHAIPQSQETPERAAARRAMICLVEAQEGLNRFPVDHPALNLARLRIESALTEVAYIVGPNFDTIVRQARNNILVTIPPETEA